MATSEKPQVEIYAWGIVAMSVCVENGTPREIVEDAANAQHPTGISSRWRVSKDEKFATGEPMPCPCPDAPDTRTHYLLNC